MEIIRKNTKKLVAKLLSFVMILLQCMSVNELEVLATTTYDESTTVLSELSGGTGLKVYQLTQEDVGRELVSGIYYVSSDLTLNEDKSKYNGLKIAEDATVYIYVPMGITLTVYGQDGENAGVGKEATEGVVEFNYTVTWYPKPEGVRAAETGESGSSSQGGGAAIYVPDTAKLILMGDGTVNATGGKGGNAGDGEKGSATQWKYYSVHVRSVVNDITGERSNIIEKEYAYDNSGENICNMISPKPYVVEGYSESIVWDFNAYSGAGGVGGAGGAGGGAGIGSNGSSGNVGNTGGVDEISWVGIEGEGEEWISGACYAVAGETNEKVVADTSGAIYKDERIVVNAYGGEGGLAGNTGAYIDGDTVAQQEYRAEASYLYRDKNTGQVCEDVDIVIWYHGQPGAGGGAGGKGAAVGNGGGGGAGGEGGSSGAIELERYDGPELPFIAVAGENGDDGTVAMENVMSSSQYPYNTITFTGATANETQTYYITKGTQIIIPESSRSDYSGWVVQTGATALPETFGTFTTKAFLSGDKTIYKAGEAVTVDALAYGDVIMKAIHHVHNYVYEVDSSDSGVIKAYCTDTTNGEYCEHLGEENAVTVKLTANTSVTYSGNTYNSDVAALDVNIENNITQVTGAQVGELIYYNVDENGDITGSAISAPSNAGRYAVTVEVGGKTAKVNFEIEKLQVEKPVANTNSFVYNKEEQTYELSESPCYEIGNNTRTDAGEQTVTVSLTDKDNMLWKDGTVEDLAFNFNIAPKSITSDMIYLDSADMSYIFDGSEIAPVVVVRDEDTELFSGENFDYVISGTESAKDAGTYRLNISGKGNYGGTVVVTWKIMKQQPPVISGVENNKTYCEKQIITITDDDLKSVTVNGEEVQLTNNQYLLEADGTIYTIVATDMAGNTESVVITVNNGHIWQKPVFIWREDYSDAEAKFVCKCDETHVQNVKAEVSTDVVKKASGTQKGEMTYTAIATLEEKEYTDTRNVETVTSGFEVVGEGSITTDIIVDSDLPEILVENFMVTTVRGLLTEEELQESESGEHIKVYLEITNHNNTVDTREKVCVETVRDNIIKETVGNEVTSGCKFDSGVEYYDISLYKKVGSGNVLKLTRTEDKLIGITMGIPEKIKSENKNRKYYVLCVHSSENGEELDVDILSTVVDRNESTIFFEADTFSTYGIMYVELNENVSITPSITKEANGTPVPVITKEASATPIPSVGEEASATPVPIITQEASATPVPSVSEEASATPVPIITQEASATPVPIITQEASATPVPIITQEASATPVPIITQEASVTPIPSISKEASATPVPVITQEASVTPIPNISKEASVTPIPSISKEASVTPIPSITEEAGATPIPSISEEASATPVPVITEKASVTQAPKQILLPQVTRKSKNRIRLKWNRISGADGYEVYATTCGNYDYMKVKAVKSGKSISCIISKIKGKKVVNKSYKFRVKAYRIVNGKKEFFKTSKDVHLIKGLYKKYGNASLVVVKKAKVSLAIGKTSRISATVEVPHGKIQKPDHGEKIRYISSDKNVATVSKTGKIKAVGKGNCKIYVVAVNGKYATVKVTVK